MLELLEHASKMTTANGKYLNFFGEKIAWCVCFAEFSSKLMVNDWILANPKVQSNSKFKKDMFNICF